MNGPLSSSKRTKHIKAKYYLAKDYSDKGDIKFSYLPTDKMWIDMHTKPKQGTPFPYRQGQVDELSDQL